MNALSTILRFGWLCLLAWPSFAQTVVISEIMYHPLSENPAEEYIELCNPGTNVVSLQGWTLNKGVELTFGNVSIAAQGYLVVAAHPPTFIARHPGIPNVVGGWAGQLSNSGNTIELHDALGTSVDEVRYADEGDWATRVRWIIDPRGWRWEADHDGRGKSLELLNAAFPNDFGQNWAASLPDGGTPGTRNSVATNNVAPLILRLEHTPVVPRSTDAVTIRALILDEQSVVNPRLFWRFASTTPLGAFTNVVMVDNGSSNDGAPGDGVYAATLAPAPQGTVVEFYVQASDPAGHVRIYPGAARQLNGTFAQTANALYQVDDSAATGPQPLYRLIFTEPERAILASFDIRQSNAEMNGTFISHDAEGTQLRYNVGVRIRGAGSRGSAEVPNYRLNIPNDRKWDDIAALNLNAQYGYSQLAGSALTLKSGLPAAEARTVQVRVNGINLARSGLPQYGSYAALEVIDSDWAARQYPLDPAGNIYVARRPNTDLSYLGTNVENYITMGYEKGSNGEENDWSDLINLTAVLNGPYDGSWSDAVRAVIDPQEWARYFAIFTLFGSAETSLGTGVGDDYDLYRGELDRRFRLVPHDLDSILAQGQGFVPTNSDLFAATLVPVVSRFLRHPDFAPLYYGELKNLADTTLAPSELNPLLDHLLSDYVPESTIQTMKDYALNRGAYVRSQIPLHLTATNTLASSNGYPRTASPSVALSGRANPITTRSVRVNGVPVGWTAWQAAWTAPSVSLLPGINRILVQALDEASHETEHAHIDVWYDDGSTVGVTGTLSANTTWTAAAGPYVVTGPVTVAAAQTLTIQPGTTVFFTPGASLIVHGQLLARGTETQRIRLARLPGVSSPIDSWAGVTINNSPVTNIISYADLEGAGAGGDSIRVVNSILLADHLIFSATTRTLIELGNASLHITDSVFPTIVGAEHIHGGPMPTNGFVIIERNIFGSTTELNDIIDFTSARRPGPVLQVLDNIFTAASDDVLDLDGTDAHIEGNLFLHVHKNNPNVGDTSSAISYGQDGGYGPHVVAVRNLFFDVDHVALAKEGGFLTLVNNTLVGVNIAAVNFSEPERNVLPGAGAFLDGNIYWNPPGYTGVNFENLRPTNGTVSLTVLRSILAGLDLPTNGIGILRADPRLVNADANAVSLQTIRDDFRLRAGSPALGTGPNGLDMGGLVPAGASISGEPPALTPLPNATLTIGGPGIVAYEWRLNNGPQSSETSISNTLVLSGLTNGTYQVQVVGKNSAGVWQSDTNATLSRTWTVQTTLTRLVINEVLARNLSAVLVGEDFPDLIELWNGGSTTIDLAGLGLTDNQTNKYKFVFPPETILGPGQFLTLVADERGGIPGLLTGFSLKAGGDQVYLYDSFGRGGGLIDSVQFGVQVPDLSIGRLSTGEWALTKPTFGESNLAAPVADASSLKINEWLAEGDTLFFDDFLELYNRDPLPAAVGGVFLTDEPLGYPRQHQIPPLSFLEGGGFTSFLADGNADAGPDHLPFKLSPQQGQIAVFNAALELIDCIIYGPQTPDVSEGRSPNGAETVVFFGSATGTQPTPGAPNPGGGSIVVVTNITTRLLELNSIWRYEASGIDLGTSWRQSTFDDSSWLAGPGLLYNENNPNIPERNTFLPFTSPQQQTFYFRTTFVATTNLNGSTFVLSSFLDDGAVIYLNGVEVLRVRMPVGAISYNTPASAFPPGGDASLETFSFPAANAVLGTNVLAVEVHQTVLPSTDVVWGAGLESRRSITNILGAGVILNEILSDNTSIPGPGQGSDWIEFYNPSANPTDLSGLSVTDDLLQPRKWIFPQGATLSPGGYLLVRCDASTPATTHLSGDLNTGFALDAEGDSVHLFDHPSRGGALLDSLIFGLQIPDFSVGRIPSGGQQWGLNLATPATPNLPAQLAASSNLKVNEWLASPASGDDDWFEIFNPNNQPVALGGLYLTDDLTDPTKHQIRALSFLGASTNGFRQFFADGNPEIGPHHVDFQLRAAGESLGIFSADGVLIDSVSFGPQLEGVSMGRLPDGAATVASFPATPTPGEANFLPLEAVVINEVLSHSEMPFEDAIELRNLTSQPIAIGGWFLSDSKAELRKFRIPDGTILPSHGLLVFYEYQFNSDPGFFGSFALSSSQGDQVYLASADQAGRLTGYRATARFGAAENGVTIGRHSTSVGVDFTRLLERTFGADNATSLEEFRRGTGRTNSAPKVGPVVISEIMYHPPDIGGTNDNTLAEFIELHNLAATPTLLSSAITNGWRLRDAVDFDFTPGTSLPAGGYLVIVSFDPQTNSAALNAFRAEYGLGASVPIVGPFRGKLNNNGDSVELLKPEEPQPDNFVPFILLERIDYQDASPWPSAADSGTNKVSLQRRLLSAYGNDPVHWQAGLPTPGGPAGAPSAPIPVITAQPQRQQVVPGANVTFQASVDSAAPLRRQWRFNDTDLPGQTNLSLTISNVQAAQAGNYSLRVSNPFGTALSQAAPLVLEIAPRIILPPRDLVAARGADATFSVGADGTLPLDYRWFFNGSLLPGENRYLLVLTNVQVTAEGAYSVVVSNQWGTASSGVATLTINERPQITVPPTNQSVLAGRTASFAVQASGTGPLLYQWRFNGMDISGATSPTLVLSNVQVSAMGQYSVRVRNLVGVAVSPSASLTVVIPPQVNVTASDGVAAEPGANAGTFTVSRTGNTDLPLTIAFQLSGSAALGSDYQVNPASPVQLASGAASAIVTVTALNDALRESVESVVLTVTDGVDYTAGSSSQATVLLFDDDNALPSIAVVAPTNGAVFALTPTNLSLQVAASDSDGSVTKVEFYNWQTNRLGQSTVPPFNFIWTNAPPGTNRLSAVATDNLGATNRSSSIEFRINLPPLISITSPSNGTVALPPADFLLTAAARDDDGVVQAVQFYLNGVLVGSDASNPYTLPLSSLGVGRYAVTARVTDDLGMSSTSAVVNLRVRIPSTQFADFFDDRGEINGSLQTITGNSQSATREPLEPGGLGSEGRTLWLSWTPSIAGVCIMDTFGSSFDTVLSVYTNRPPTLAVPSNLGLVTENDDFDQVQSWVAFVAEAGVTYHVRISGFGPGDFGPFQFHQLLLTAAPLIVVPPYDQIIGTGRAASFTVVATNFQGPQLFYQWRRNGLDIPGATNTFYNIPLVQDSHLGNYDVVVRNDVGTVTSVVARLAFGLPPTIVVGPRSQTVVEGENVTFTVEVSGSGPFGYRWRRGSTTIVPVGQSSLTLTNVQLAQAGNYNVVITNSVNSAPGVLSGNAVLTVLADTDHDHMPDTWETANLFDRLDSADGIADSDGDGANNASEYLAGTNPRDAQSYLKVDRLTWQNEAAILQFLAVSNHSYSVLYQNALQPGPWTKAGDVAAHTTNRVLSVTNSVPGVLRRFYRLVTPQQP